MTDKKNTGDSEAMTKEELDNTVENEPKKEYDDLVQPTDETVELPTEEEIEEVVGSEPDEEENKENDSL